MSNIYQEIVRPLKGLEIGEINRVLINALEQNRQRIFLGLSDGTKDLSVNSITANNLIINSTEITSTTETAEVNTRYYANNAGLVIITLPTTASIGDWIEIRGKGAGGWKVAQNALQQIIFGTVSTTVGVGGSLASTQRYDCIRMECQIANTTWMVVNSVGNLTIV